ncbi:relaxase domain-containing protein [Amycolatopsis sp. EV170708-02-1]|uniref:relaxase domain-containing protein n=1 Tax=Amycolatopsis sp. EV170708-02-1 TaxID=2919322 RepID=UPI001F0BF121|nr:relaxase domain-containing protein [Amycolatopsis sp. EV170708-02-1]UMP03407.1 relaxase domain-containing protein [Amycolatopsis sp. EV170708-02-1]
MPLLRHNPERAGSTRSANTAAPPDRSALAVPPGARDITLAAPKSVSVPASFLSPEDERLNAVFTGHESAVLDVLSWLDENAAFAHSGTDTFGCRGLNTMVVLHTSSARRHPHIHSHVLVDPTVTGMDGRPYPVDWDVFEQALIAAAPLYRASLRHNLVQSLGVTWTRDHHGSEWQIAGVPEALLFQWPDTTCDFPSFHEVR